MTPENLKNRLQEYPIDVQFFEHDFKGSPKIAADRLTAKFGYKPLGESWCDLDWDYRPYKGGQLGDPNIPLAETLQGKAMAHTEVWFTEEEAYQLAIEFYQLFSNKTLTRLTNHIGNGWIPITPYTFESVHIAMDNRKIGMILVVDED